MEQVLSPDRPTRVATPTQTITSSNRQPVKEDHAHFHAEETLEWVRKGSNELLSGQIQKLSEEIQTLRAALEETRQMMNGHGDATTKTIPDDFNLSLETQKIQRQWILSALEQSRGHVSEAARLLKVSRPGLYDKIRTPGIAIPKPRVARQTERVTAAIPQACNGARRMTPNPQSSAPAYAL